MALNPMLKELVNRHGVSALADRIADLECSVYRQGATIKRLTAELKAAKAEVKAARLEVRLLTAAQAQEQARHDLDYAYWMQDQEGASVAPVAMTLEQMQTEIARQAALLAAQRTPTSKAA